MITSHPSRVNIVDLPNEMLLIIFSKLKTVDVLYSLVDVNERFDQLVFESFHVHSLDAAKMIIKSDEDVSVSIDNRVLTKICEKILPRIHHQLNELTVEQHSMERILLKVNYPQLHSLSLVYFQEEMLFRYLSGMVSNFAHFI